MSLSVFISYADEDEPFVRELENHLTILQYQDVITAWSKRNISAGTDRKREIDIHLNRAEIVLLLISANFLASNYCYSTEMKQALARHDAG